MYEVTWTLVIWPNKDFFNDKVLCKQVNSYINSLKKVRLVGANDDGKTVHVFDQNKLSFFL